MQSLNKPATKVFNGLLNKLGLKDYLVLESEGFIPLSAEKVAADIVTDYGRAFLLSLSHHYLQNGDLMRDPEMAFIVADYRAHKKDFANLYIFPQLYRQDNMGIYEESVSVNAGKAIRYNERLQKKHAAFANQWLGNIQAQGFLK